MSHRNEDQQYQGVLGHALTQTPGEDSSYSAMELVPLSGGGLWTQAKLPIAKEHEPTGRAIGQVGSQKL